MIQVDAERTRRRNQVPGLNVRPLSFYGAAAQPRGGFRFARRSRCLDRIFANPA
jgi:hypothetical protein